MASVENPLGSDVWKAFLQWRAQEAELRVNFTRILAVGGFYIIHLLHHYSSALPLLGFLELGAGGKVSPALHIAVTAIAAAWIAWALLVQSSLRQGLLPGWMPAASTVLDIVLLTAMVILGSGARSPLVCGYLLVIMLAALRLNLRLVWLSAAGSLLGFLVVLGCSRWPRGFLLEHDLPIIPRYQQFMFLLAIVAAGVIAGQWVRHAQLAGARLLAERRQEADHG
jgi:hypothetical protein